MGITISVKDVMDQKVVYVKDTATVAEVLSTMIEHNVWSVVVTRDDFPYGVITERDILRRAISKGYDINKTRAMDIASSPILTMEPNAPIGEALNVMALKAVRRIYITEHGKIIGRVTQTEILKNMLNVMRTLASLPHQL